MIENRKKIIPTFNSLSEIVQACLLTSLINYLSLYSDVPELGYTIITQKEPILIDSSTVMAKVKKY